jgi:transposase-like protein
MTRPGGLLRLTQESPEEKMMPKRKPYKRSPERERLVLTSLEFGLSLTAAAKIAGVSASAIGLWRRTDPAFAAATLRAQKQFRDKLREALNDCKEEQ